MTRTGSDAGWRPEGGQTPLLLNLFVDEDAQDDPDESEQIHLKGKPNRESQEPQVEGDGRGQPGTDGLGKHVLNNTGGRNGQQDFTEEPAEHAPD
jgi:hypothetical protein